MTRLNGNLEELLISKSKTEDEVLEVRLDGGSGWK